MNDVTHSCRAPIPLERLVEYWLGETDATATDAIDEHLLGCDACGARLDEIVALGRGVRAAVNAGLVSCFVAPAFVERLAAAGWRVREYRVPRNGLANCSIAPDDDAVFGRLQVPLQGVTRLDAVLRSSLSPGADRRVEDLPFDPRSGEVIFMPGAAGLRHEPANRLEVRLLAVEDASERVIGDYVLDHRPWPAT